MIGGHRTAAVYEFSCGILRHACSRDGEDMANLRNIELVLVYASAVSHKRR